MQEHKYIYSVSGSLHS